MRTRIWNRWSIVLGAGMAICGAFAVPAHADNPVCVASAPVAASDAAAIHLQPGFAVRQVVTDLLLGRRWAVVEDCSHPERPLEMVELPISPSSPAIAFVQAKSAPAVAPAQTALFNSPRPAMRRVDIQSSPPSSRSIDLAFTAHDATPATAPSPLLVRAGDRVHLRSDSANVRLEIEAISLDYGHAGQVIHLRRLGSDAAQRVMLAGLVNGADSAELLP